jgi:hypothetical protein
MFDFFKLVKSPQHRLAWLVALVADAIQIFAFPIFSEGAVSPADAILDVITGAILARILGWHWAFLPTIAAELVPVVDIFPTWTAAVFYVTQKQARSSEPEILPPLSGGRR